MSSARNCSTVTGLGELTYDHIFVREGDEVRYVTSRGGGTLANVLVNITSRGGKAEAICATGDDIFGHTALNELQGLGVATRYVALRPRRRTRLIYEVIHNIDGVTSHDFSMTCPACGSRSADSHFARLDTTDASAIRGSEVSILVTDRMTNERLTAARTARVRGALTVLDLGRLGYLRYYPVSYILSGLRCFDVASMPRTVAESIVNRAQLNSLEDLLRVGPRQCALITDGPNGMAVLEKAGSQIRRVQIGAPHCDRVIDDSGAGDALLASILRAISWGTSTAQTVRSWSRLAHEACAELPEILTAYGARGHIPRPHKSAIQHLVALEGLPLQTIRQHTGSELCPFCYVVQPLAPRMKRSGFKVGARSNVKELFRRTFFAIERRDAVAKCTDLLNQAEGTAYVVGTGGSYPVAMFLAVVFAQHSRIFARPMRPYDYLKAAGQSTFVFVLSYSGSTADCRAVIDAAHKRGASVILVTGAARPRLAESLRGFHDCVISYAPKRGAKAGPRERGFVSIAGTVAPCALWTAAVTGGAAMTRLAEELQLEREHWQKQDTSSLSKAIATSGRVAVFGSGFAWPSVVDFESKFTEAGVARVEVHEAKDFSHGRFVSLLTETDPRTPVVMLGVGRWTRYEVLLFKTLSAKKRTVWRIKAKNIGIEGALELLMRMQFIAQKCGEDLGRDISRPTRIPPAGLALYRWSAALQ